MTLESWLRGAECSKTAHLGQPSHVMYPEAQGFCSFQGQDRRPALNPAEQLSRLSFPASFPARSRQVCRERNLSIALQGTPEAPRCGFSATVVAKLRSAGVPFGSFDILTDQAVREGLKVRGQTSDHQRVEPAYENGVVESGQLTAADVLSTAAGRPVTLFLCIHRSAAAGDS